MNTAPVAPVYRPAPQPVPQPAPQPAPQPVPQPVPQSTYYAPPAAPQPVREHPFADRVRDAVRKLGSSPLFLVAAICFTLVQLLSLLFIGNMGNTLYDSLYPLLREMGMSTRDIRELLSGIADAGGLFGIFSMIPGILIMSGLWMVYGSSLSRTKKTGTAGLTMIQVVSIIELVGLGIVMAIVLIPLLIAMAEISGYSGGMASAAMTGLLIVFVLVAAIAAFIFVYYIKLCTTISKVKNTLLTGVPNRRVSGFVAVICFISGGFTALNVLLNLATLTELAYVNIATVLLSLLPSLLSAAVQVLMGVLIFMYKSKMAQLEQGDAPVAAPVYQSAQPAYQPAYQQPVAPQPVAPQPVYQPAAPAPVAQPVVVQAPVVEEIPVPVVEEVIVEAPVVEAEPVVEVAPAEEAAPVEAVVEAPVEESAPTAEI